jgi:hypothetical protein
MGQQLRRLQVELQLPVRRLASAVLEERFLRKTVSGDVSSHYHCPDFRCPVDVSCSSPSTVMLAYATHSEPDELTTWSTFSQMARFASSMAWRDPTRPISRSISAPDACETLILQPVSDCIDLMVSPPIVC